MPPIRIRQLQLKGLSKDYGVSFLANGTSRGLSVISGEISTGKTSILEFIDFCLGARDHPRFQEISRQALVALLEVELNESTCVIERPLFSNDRFAWVHECDLEHVGGPHVKSRRPLDPAGAPDSLSNFLLNACGLAGVLLREAPSQANSGVDPLSFRDLMWLCYLDKNRIGTENLMHESAHMQNLKLVQVIELVFGVYDQQVAALDAMIKSARSQLSTLESEIEALTRFLQDQEVPDDADLDHELEQIRHRATQFSEQLNDISIRMRSATEFAQGLRERFAENNQAAREASTRLRDRQTLLHRLLPLRGQYGEDEKKLIFFDQAKQLFDPLRVTVCPACLQALDDAATIKDGKCSLCGRELTHESEEIDVKAELRAVRDRLRQIEAYVREVEDEIAEEQRSLNAARLGEEEAQRQLDDQVASTLSPYVAQRDQLVRDIQMQQSARQQVERQQNWRASLLVKREESVRVQARIDELSEQLKRVRENQPSKDEVVFELSERFDSVLRAFGFPKIDDPQGPLINTRFVPLVRGNPYHQLLSDGALTLAGLAWFLSIAELAHERGSSFPGFVMIDSPQKGLRPAVGSAGDEFQSPIIANAVWRRLASSSLATSGQMIVVDNLPPAFVEENVVVRYSGQARQPPYGLIDNEDS